MRLPSDGAAARSVISGVYTRWSGSGLGRAAESQLKGIAHTAVQQRFDVTAEPLDPVRIAALISTPACGAVATFVGLVRDHNKGRRVLWLHYEAYAPLARSTFERIGAEAASQWPSMQLAIHHRTGRLEIGDASVVIASASPHRSDAFAACRYAIERVKQIAPVWKHEHFDGGDVWIEGATADPEDESARQTALERACS
jgi:molybdopterin synthase catalytic subunit